MLSRRKTPEEVQAEARLTSYYLFLFWILSQSWPVLLIGLVLAVMFVEGALAFVAMLVLAIRLGNLEAFVLWVVIFAVFAFIGLWYVASVRRERRAAMPPPKLPIAEERKKAEALWKFVPEEKPREMTRAEKKKIAEFWNDPSASMSKESHC